jgi:hypothetical protein
MEVQSRSPAIQPGASWQTAETQHCKTPQPASPHSRGAPNHSAAIGSSPAASQSTAGSSQSVPVGVGHDTTGAAVGAPQPQQAAAGQIPSALQRYEAVLAQPPYRTMEAQSVPPLLIIQPGASWQSAETQHCDTPQPASPHSRGAPNASAAIGSSPAAVQSTAGSSQSVAVGMAHDMSGAAEGAPQPQQASAGQISSTLQ